MSTLLEGALPPFLFSSSQRPPKPLDSFPVPDRSGFLNRVHNPQNLSLWPTPQEICHNSPIVGSRANSRPWWTPLTSIKSPMQYIVPFHLFYRTPRGGFPDQRGGGLNRGCVIRLLYKSDKHLRPIEVPSVIVRFHLTAKVNKWWSGGDPIIIRQRLRRIREGGRFKADHATQICCSYVAGVKIL